MVTQMTLGKRMGVSIGLVNTLLKRRMRNSYVKARKVSFKRYAYYVTPKGFSEKKPARRNLSGKFPDLFPEWSQTVCRNFRKCTRCRPVATRPGRRQRSSWDEKTVCDSCAEPAGGRCRTESAPTGSRGLAAAGGVGIIGLAVKSPMHWKW